MLQHIRGCQALCTASGLADCTAAALSTIKSTVKAINKPCYDRTCGKVFKIWEKNFFYDF